LTATFAILVKTLNAVISGSTVVEHLPHHTKVEGSSPATSANNSPWLAASIKNKIIQNFCQYCHCCHHCPCYRS
jgi:hypothetical protein